MMGLPSRKDGPITTGNKLHSGAVAASRRRPPIVDRDDPYSIQPSALMKDQEEEKSVFTLIEYHYSTSNTVVYSPFDRAFLHQTTYFCTLLL